VRTNMDTTITRRSKPYFRAGLALVFALTGMCVAAKAQLSDTATTGTTIAQSSDIDSGDLLMVDVYGAKDLSGSLRVDEAGTVKLPVGGTVMLRGLTPAHAARVIERQLRDAGIVLDPQVTVTVVQYGTPGVIVLGEVLRPGTYPLRGTHTLYQALSAAGGMTANAGGVITITHQGSAMVSEEVPVTTPDYSASEQTTVVKAGDTVVVAKAPLMYVVGDVNRSGPVPMPYGQPLTVMRALSISGGTTPTSASKHASIVRQVGDQVLTIPVDLDKVRKAETPDPLLRANDVLVIPRSGAKVFMQFALPSATSAVTGAVSTALIIR